ncbi:hypothetical protein [Pedobacter sp. UYP1]|uniref:hypothetical protein n=1 Tax=Pedobacter sp. UYP1 TaxID=1756396 RepID=UPI0033949B69
MIEINFLDAKGIKILSLTTIEEVRGFFSPTVDCSSPQTLLLDLISNHYRYILNGTEYYFHQNNIDNVSGKFTVNYDLVL